MLVIHSLAHLPKYSLQNLMDVDKNVYPVNLNPREGSVPLDCLNSVH